ncbi:hypothetical protein FRC06_010736 [Ceratobasidium sp. 370]|nr:hypothetical protein FRC06_010736 [Ceratobasidium sp. 370]
MACPHHVSKDPPPLLVNGTVDFQARHVGWIVSGGFTVVSVVASLWLIQKHARWYYCKPQQRHIIRLLLMVPIYSTITLASYIFLAHATSLLLIRDAYESVVLASFFTLMLQYLPGPVPPPPPEHGKPRVGPHKRLRSWSHRHSRSGSHRTEEDGEETRPITVSDPDANPQAEKPQMSKAERRAVIHQTFHALQMRPSPGSDPAPSKPPFKWVWPFGGIRAVPRDGLAYLQYMRWGILQYCIVRPGTFIPVSCTISDAGLRKRQTRHVEERLGLEKCLDGKESYLRVEVGVREAEQREKIPRMGEPVWGNRAGYMRSYISFRDDSVPRSFIKTQGYRGLPVTDDLDDPYTTMYATMRPIRRPMPELNPNPLPTPQTSPTRGGSMFSSGTPIALDDPPPASVWRAQAGVRPLPPGAYIPRLPGSPVPWIGLGGGRVESWGSLVVRAESHRTGLVMATPPPTPPPPPPAPGRQTTRSGMGRGVGSFMIERNAGSSMVERNPTSPLAQLNTAPHVAQRDVTPPMVERHAGMPGSLGMRTIGAHIPPVSQSRHRPLAPNVRLSAIPNPGARSPPHSLLRPESRRTSTPQSPFHPRIPDARTSSPTTSDDVHPPSRDDSLLARMFSGARSTETGYTVLETVARSDARSTRSSSYRTAPDGASSRSMSPSVGTSGERSPGTASYRTWERAVVRTGQVVVLEQNSENEHRPLSASVTALGTPGGEVSRPSSVGSLVAPPSPARPPGRPQGPSIQPTMIVLPAPLSPARYPHWPWRAPAPPEARPAPWSLLQGQQNSSSGGLAGWAAGRSAAHRDESSPVVAAHVNGSSWLSNIEDRYPAMSPRSPRDSEAPR